MATGLQSTAEQRAHLRQIALPHLDAAFKSGALADDHPQRRGRVVQEASLRAFKFFDRSWGETARLAAGDVRNTG